MKILAAPLKCLALSVVPFICLAGSPTAPLSARPWANDAFITTKFDIRREEEIQHKKCTKNLQHKYNSKKSRRLFDIYQNVLIETNNNLNIILASMSVSNLIFVVCVLLDECLLRKHMYLTDDIFKICFREGVKVEVTTQK